MLFCITNKCSMECPHCMSDCKPDGQFLEKKDITTFINFFNFMKFRSLLISGGEPTEHPDFSWIVETLAQKCKPLAMVIVSNGSFIDHKHRFDAVVKLMRKYPFLRLQITSIKGLYKNHDSIVRVEDFIRGLFSDRVSFETERIVMMRPLGRAATNPEIMEMVKQTNNGYNDCSNTTLISIQTQNIKDFAYNCESLGKFCMPMVDYKLDVHMSESMLCPSVGNLKDDGFLKVFERMKNFTPCGKCGSTDKVMNLINQIKSK